MFNARDTNLIGVCAVHRAGRLGKGMDEEAARYTSSLEFDREILEAVIYVNMAHVRLLERVGVLSEQEAREAVMFLDKLLESPPSLDRHEFEDIHMVVEDWLSRHSPRVGAMLALGKSRNDAVVAAIKLRLKQRIAQLHESIDELCATLLKRAEREAETIFPVYTHLQRAAPATFGFILHSYATRLLKLYPHLRLVYELCDESPLGSAAVAGTSVPLDREYAAQLLGFGRVSDNALEATASRDFIIESISLTLLVALILSSLAEELVLYSSEEFSLLELPDELSATSSIMPQKKNPVVAEITRTKVWEVLGLLSTALGIAARQPSGYSLDLQQITPKLWKALDETVSALRLTSKMIENITINTARSAEACKPPTGIVEVANHLTLNYGIPFRKAHNLAGRLSRLINEGRLTPETFQQTLHEAGVSADITLDDVLQLMEPRRVVYGYRTRGSANPQHVKTAVNQAFQELERQREWFLERRRRLENALEALRKTV